MESLSKDDEDVTVTFAHFENVTIQTKGGEKQQLKQVTTEAYVHYLLDFISKFLCKLIHHRNELKNYRCIISKFLTSFNNVFLDLDFAENLTLPMKYQPQSLHWAQEVVTVHSSISKSKDGKIYHPYISNTRKHDQVFVKIAMQEMLSEEDVSQCDAIIIESDNCASQYKSGLHFHHLQEIANNYSNTVIRIYGIPNHGKGEVDHVGGTAKVTETIGSWWRDIPQCIWCC